jgi:hypothetical protein
VKRTDNFTELQKEFKLFEAWKHKNKIFEKKSRQRLKLFSLLPPVASKHFRLQGASPQSSEIPCSINCLTHWYS